MDDMLEKVLYKILQTQTIKFMFFSEASFINSVYALKNQAYINIFLGFNYQQKSYLSSGKSIQSNICFQLMLPYKQTAKTEIKNAMKRFNKSTKYLCKTSTIQKKLNKKKYMRQTFNYFQKQIKSKSPQDCHVLNFYNMISINELSIRNPNHDESHTKTQFYYKNMKKVEITENYLLIYLQSNHSLACPVSQFIARYKQDQDIRFRKIGQMLEDIEKMFELNQSSQSNNSCLREEATALFDKLGTTPYIGKVGSNQLAVSKSMMDLFGYSSEQYIIECMKFQIPLFQGLSCQSYYDIVIKNLETVILLMDLLNGRIPLKTFEQLNYFQFKQKISSKNNIQYTCKMSLSMPVPLITIIKLQQILQTKQKLKIDGGMQNCKDFQQYYKQIRQKQYQTLQYLIELPDNKNPQNKQKVADYVSVSQEDSVKSTYTFSQSK